MSDQVDVTRDDYTTKQAADLAGVDPSYLRRLLIDGRIEGRNVGGRVWLISGRSLADWLDSRQ